MQPNHCFLRFHREPSTHLLDFPPSACDFYVMSDRPFVYDRVIEQQVTEFNKMFPILIGSHTQDRIEWSVDFRHCGLEFLICSSLISHITITLKISLGSKLNNIPFQMHVLFLGNLPLER